MTINSEFIVRGLDTGFSRDEPFLVLEWMEGGTLQHFIHLREYHLNDVVRITAQLLKAFRELQRFNLVHRDLKPNNILLTADNCVKLSDLGILRVPESTLYLTGTGDQLGSLLYISERQRFAPDQATPRDDFYSLCLILYELISQRRIHNRNIPLANLRSPLAPLALSMLVDRGMEDLEDWQSVFEEMCLYVDLKTEVVSSEFIGSNTLPENVVKIHVDRIIQLLGGVVSPIIHTDVSPENTAFLDKVVSKIAHAFRKCASEFIHLGVEVEISSPPVEDGNCVYFWAKFGDDIYDLIVKHNLEDYATERLYGWFELEIAINGTVSISHISGKRLFADFQYLPDDTFDRVLSRLDECDEAFLNRFGRGLAIGAAIGAIESIEDLFSIDEDE